MIGIEVINSTNPYDFGEKLEIFLNEHPEAKILFGSIKGIEGGKGVFAVFSYDKEATIPIMKEDISLQEVEDGREMLKQANDALAEKEKLLKAQAAAKTKSEKAAAKKAAEIESLKLKIKELQEVKIAE